MFKKTGGGFTLIALILAGCVLVLKDFPDNVRTGIDLRGGTELSFSVPIERLPASAQGTALAEIKTVLQNRFDQYGIKELSIATRGNDSLVIQVPTTDDEEIDELIEAITTSGKLSIHLVSEQEHQAPEVQESIQVEWSVHQANKDDETAQEPTRRVVSTTDANGKVVGKLTVENDNTGDGITWVDGDDLADAFPTTDQYGRPAVGFQFNDAGASAFGTLTGANQSKSLAIVLDDMVQSQATIRARITSQGILEGDYTAEEIKKIVTVLKSGSLAVSPVFESENRIGALLGQDSVSRGTQAMAVGFVLVLVFMLVYYHFTLGGIGTLTLLFNMTMIITLIIVFRNSVTLPGLAGLLLTIGMAVDANILIYERIREERKRGRSLTQSITTGYDKAFSTIVDANLTTLITAYILFKFGSTAVKGFAVILSIGIMTSVFSSLYFSRLVMTFAVNRNFISDLKMMQIIDQPSFKFLDYRKPARTASIVLITIGILCLAVRGSDNLGIDFTGGSRVVVNVENALSQAEMSELLKNVPGDKQVQAVGAVSGESTTFSVRTSQVVEGDATENTFKKHISDALEGKLAPPPMENESTADTDTGTQALAFSADVYLRSSEAGKALSGNDVKTLLEDREFPVASVQKKEVGRGAWSAFVVASTEQVNYVAAKALKGDLAQILKDDTTVVLSEQFPEVSTIGSRVAQDMQGKVLIAMFLAFAAIIFYISLRFEFKFGLAAIVALVHDILFTLGALSVGDLLFGSFLNLKFNLPVVAALLTVVGYSLNDTIVIFDRIRENLGGKKYGVDYEPVINTSINQTLSRTVLTSVTTFIVVVILLVWGGEALNGFAFALTVGVVVGTYSSMYVASPSLVYFHKRAEARREAILEEAAAAG